MLILRCTQKLLRAMRLDPAGIREIEEDPSYGSWFADLFVLQRRKALLLTNSATLYSVVIPHVRAPHLQDLPELFLEHLSRALSMETFADLALESLDSQYGTVVFARTNNRRVLGSMNDFRFQIEMHVRRNGPLTDLRAAVIGRALNRTPMSFLGYRYAVDLMEGLVRPKAP